MITLLALYTFLRFCYWWWPPSVTPLLPRWAKRRARALTGSEENSQAHAFRVAIIGAGFNGIAMGIKLKEMGLNSFVILEQEAEIGGTWHYNRYPDAACDVPAHLYSFSFAPKLDWTANHPPHSEILQYLKRVVDRYGLRKHIHLRHRVDRAIYQPDKGSYQVSLTAQSHDADDDAEHYMQLECQVLVACTGQLGEPFFPRIVGLKREIDYIQVIGEEEEEGSKKQASKQAKTEKTQKQKKKIR